VTEPAWLALALVAGALFAVGWIKRELWIHRRRRASRERRRDGMS
jgi:hypothetical protein